MDIIKVKDFQRIYQVDVFEDEYRKLFKKNASLFRDEHEKLYENLVMLDDGGFSALELQQFERITAHRPLCSIRHVGKSNPRVIFVFAESDAAIVLLSCMLEKECGDYSSAIARAEQRLKLL